MNNEVFGKLCPYCKTPLSQDDNIVICDTCDMPHHLNCWLENRGCTTFGCNGSYGEVYERSTDKSAKAESLYAMQDMKSENTELEVLRQGDKSVIWYNMPVMLDRSMLLIDRVHNQVYAVCELRNIGDVRISAVMVEITCSDIWGSALEAVESHQYLDLSIRRGDVFGHSEIIALSDRNTRNIGVSIKKVLLDDGTLLNGDEDCCMIPAPMTLESFTGSRELAAEYARLTTDRAAFVPVVTDQYWRCTCGMVWGKDVERCCECASVPEMLLAALNVEKLQESMQAYRVQIRAEEERKRAAEAERIRLAQEQVERERLRKEQEIMAAEQAAKKKKRRKKTITTIVTLLIITTVLACGTVFFGIPYYHYVNACKLLEEFKYDEAHQAFLALDGFLNSEEFVNESLYRKAHNLLKEKKFDEAIKQYDELGSYKESAEKLKNVKYSKAEDALTREDYDLAIEVYTELGDYQDCKEKIKLSNYRKANDFFKKEKYKEAYLLYVELDDYEDAEDVADECVELWVDKLLNSGNASSVNDFVKTVKLSSEHHSMLYTKISSLLKTKTDPDYWYGNHSDVAYTLLNKVPESFMNTKDIKSVMKALDNRDLRSGSYVRKNMDFIRSVWEYDVVKNAMKDDSVLTDFLIGNWKTSGGSYYIKFTYKEKEGYHNSSFNLPWVSKPKGTEYFNITDLHYVWESGNGKELAKVFNFTLQSVDTMEVYCYKNKKSYTLYRE